MEDELARDVVLPIEELAAIHFAWLAREYHVRAHDTTGQPPRERFLAEVGELRAAPSPEKLEEIFLHRAKRTVRKDATVRWGGDHLEVRAELVGKRVELRFDPCDPSARPKVYQGDAFVSDTVPLDRVANMHRARRRVSGYGRLRRAFQQTVEDRTLGVLSGEPGVGKTTAIRNLISELPRPDYQVIYLSNTWCSTPSCACTASTRTTPARCPPCSVTCASCSASTTSPCSSCITPERTAPPGSPGKACAAPATSSPGPSRSSTCDATVRSAGLLEQAVLAALATAPLTRADLRTRLRVRNERLGETLTRLADLGAVRRVGDRWAVPHSHSRPP